MVKYLIKKYRKYHARLRIPKEVQRVFGQLEFRKSLGTESLTEAERLLHPIVGEWKRAIALARAGKATEALKVIDGLDGGKQAQTLSDLRKEYDRLRQRDDFDPDVYDGVMAELIEDMTDDEDQAREAYLTVVGARTPIMEYVDRWLSEKKATEKTKSDYRSVVEALSKKYKTIEAVKRRDAGVYISGLVSAVAPARVHFVVGTISGYWKWLIGKGFVDQELANPWDNQPLPQKQTGVRKHFSDDDLISIFKELRGKDRHDMLNVCRIGLMTGMRLNEICAIKKTHVNAEYIEIPKSKTPSGIRLVPIHRELKPIINYLMEDSKGEYLIAGLSTQNKYGSRSAAIGKRINTVLDDLGFDDRMKKFHSFRASLIRAFKAAGVPEHIAQDVCGHKTDSLTYMTYAGILDIEDQAKAMDQVKYSENVMRWFRLD
ncbi:DUF6538 domain-containing protein [Thalassospira lucentensis]|uniref:DUF6538 domain-containing protein n=1 Tax=Thalassospira lucentensis TaxID=168935 RepID=UPI003AA80D45